jgi:ATP-dependent DNA helicase RecQ
VIQPSPASLDRVRGRLVEAFDGRALATCRTSAGDAETARWRQYRAVWAFVEGDECRRRTILRHFGDLSEPAPEGPCCDVCNAELVPDPPAAARATRNGEAPAEGDLDAAIVDVVVTASPSVGRTRAVEILRGGRSKVIAQNSYDGLPAYGTFAHLTKDEVLERVDELVSAGTLRSTGGRFPKLAQT